MRYKYLITVLNIVSQLILNAIHNKFYKLSIIDINTS